jgi:hypothetical protein
MRSTCLFLGFLAACTSAGENDSVDSAAVDTSDTASDTWSLDTCAGTVDDGVPEPFASWFRCADVAVVDGDVVFHATSLPPHPSAYYPEGDANHVAWDDRGGQWHQNPNEISAQELLMKIPVDPTPKGITITEAMVDEQAGTSQEEYRGDFQGIGLDGTALFTGVAAPGDLITEEEYTFDLYEGHPTDVGVYHHHGANPAALAVLVWLGVDTTTVPGSAEVELYGMMCDGTAVLGCTELDGTAVTADELDAQNGHVATLKAADGTTLFTDRYHVHACAALGRTLTPEIQYYEGTCL